MADEQQHWQALQMRVCAKCIDGDGHGGCRLPQGTTCAVKQYFPQVLQSVLATYNPVIEPYIERLRNKVCGICIHHSEDGTCPMRTEIDCALDRYYPLIVEVIEETQGAAQERSG